ncbi:MAG: polymer-forming cytoskeletal protein [Acidobacteriota bacterium]
MWKKSEEEQSHPPREAASKPLSPVQQLKERAIVGHSISIRGDITGQEDLVIYGKVEGKVNLKGNNVTIGQDGKVKADVTAKIISVEGQVQGNLKGEEQVIVRKSGNVEGNISAPRVSLEDGCRFSGQIDMQEKHPPRLAKPVAELERPKKVKAQSAAV